MAKKRVIVTQRHEALVIHYMLLTQAITRLADSLFHIIRLHRRRRYGRSRFQGDEADVQAELADVICQVKQICKILGLSFETTEQLGDVREKERRDLFLKKHPNEPWI